MLWTEDWMPDSASHRWSYYSARMRSAIALSNYSDEMIFSGYIVTRSSGQQQGGLLQRPLTMVGSGAKAVRYYNFGPECETRSNSALRRAGVFETRVAICRYVPGELCL